MAKKQKLTPQSYGQVLATSKTQDLEIVGLDTDLGIFELTDLFSHNYRYHNEIATMEYGAVTGIDLKRGKVLQAQKTLARFPALRRIEACRLGVRPFPNGSGISVTRPNYSFGYLKMFLTYLVLPYKAVFTDSRFVKINLDQKLYDATKLTEQEQEQQKFEAAQLPNIPRNAEISADVTNCYIDVTNISRRYRACKEQIPQSVAQNALGIFLHCDIDWAPKPISPLDLVTEPQCSWDSENWNHYFVIEKMPVQEVLKHIREETPYWNCDALRWALENSFAHRGILSRGHRDTQPLTAHDENMCSENFMVRSFYHDKSARRTNVGAYYGHLYVVKAVYVNKDGKVNVATFFPSADFLGAAADRKQRFRDYKEGKLRKNSKDVPPDMRGADILYFRKDVFPNMRKSITIVPADRSEPTLERQRNYGQDLFPICEATMRIDSAMLNMGNIIGTPLYKNRVTGVDAQSLEDLELELGDFNDLGDRDIVTVPWTADVTVLGSVRGLLLRQMSDMSFLGGLDGQELKGNSQDKSLVGMRLVKDARVHKHRTEDFALGLQDSNEVTVGNILDRASDKLLDDPLLKWRFYERLSQVHGHDLEVFKYKKSEIIPDTGLPYWVDVKVLRNGASSFGAAEVVIFQELKQLVGESIDQTGMQAMNRIIIKSLLGAQDSEDILGSPGEQRSTDQDQIYRSRIENGGLIAGILSGYQNFEDIPILPDKDNHVLHLTESHLPKMENLLEALQNGEVTPAALAELTEDQLETRTVMILQLGSMMTHTQKHLDMLDRFGEQRDDISDLKERGNYVVQSAESLLNVLQRNLRALEEKRAEKEMRLRGMSPENEIKRQEIEVELQKLQVQREKDQGSLMLANRIAENKRVEHLDKQVSKARDRSLKREIATANQGNQVADRQLYEQEINNDMEAQAVGTGV